MIKINCTRKIKIFLKKYHLVLVDKKVSEPESSLKFILFKCFNFNLYKYNIFFKYFLCSKSIEKITHIHHLKHKFLRLLTKRLHDYPIQYILGEWFFRDLIFECNRPVLIPRIETEKLVDILSCNLESRSRKIENKESRKLKFLEIGIGTGILFITVLKKYQELTCVGLDIDSRCIELSLKNAERILNNTNRYKLIHEDFLNFKLNNETKFDFIISNPPYVKQGDFQVMKDVIKYESHLALFSGKEGLDLISSIISLSRSLVKIGGFVILEINQEQENLIFDLLIKNKFSQFLFEKDIFNKTRFVIFYIN
jgi:release factor glutamine methyltransferase